MANIKDIQYLINIRSNVSNAEIIFGTEIRGNSPNSFFTTLNEVRNNFNGRVKIQLRKNGYISETEYDLVFSPNPEFIEAGGRLQTIQNTDETFSNVSEYILIVNKFVNGLSVEFDNGRFTSQPSYDLYFDLKPQLQTNNVSGLSAIRQNITNLSTQGLSNTTLLGGTTSNILNSSFLSQNINNLATRGLPTTSNTFSDRTLINVSSLSASTRFNNIGRFLPLTEPLRQSILPQQPIITQIVNETPIAVITPLQPVFQPVSSDRPIISPVVDEAISLPEPIQTIILPVEETPSQIFIEPTEQIININLFGILGSAKIIINNESERIIDKPSDIYKFNLGDRITIVSNNVSKFRVTEIGARGNTINSIERAETTSQTLTKQIVISESLIIDIKTQEIVIPTLQLPSISLLNPTEDRVYNINTNAPYPIAIRKNNIVNSLRVVVNDVVTEYRNLGNTEEFIILISEKKLQSIGRYKITIIPRNNDGDGDPIDVGLNVVDDIWVGQPDIRNIRYPSKIQGPDFVGTDVEFEISWESVNTDVVRIKRPGGSSFIDASPTGRLKLNVGDILKLDGNPFSETDNQISIVLILTPYNKSGREVLVGKDEILNIRFSKGLLTIPRNVAVNRILHSFSTQFDTSILEIETSKYLTHALHLGGGENKIITTWTGSRIDNDESLIVKLYEPLPTSVQPNQQVWISKYQSNPILLETVTLSTDIDDVCVPLKGPNFTIEPDNGIGFSMYDDLIAVGSQTSTDLINRYLGKNGIDTSKLNIKYTDADTYLFENFVNFGSAVERVNNFYYKIQLLQSYITQLNNVIESESLLLLNDESLIILTENNQSILTDITTFTFNTITEQISANKLIESINSVIRSFDGFEEFLYKSPNPQHLVYPKEDIVNVNIINSLILDTTDIRVIEWYERIINVATDYDKNNPNYIINNIPQFISTDNSNKDFLLFFDMIGQHFDAIWVYINKLVQMKTVDEAGVLGIPNEYVSEILKSLGWNPKRAYDSQFLWEYVFGTDKDGNPKYSTSLENANNQVWRRILNNLPYLLKHKGTARSLKAIMACYGIPNSMLTIMEFGGPEDPNSGRSTKFTFEDRTASIKLKNGSSISIPWKLIPSSNDYPQSIEFMIKPDVINTSVEILTAGGFELFISPTGSLHQLEIHIGGDIDISAPFNLSTQHYSNLLINKIDIDSTTANYEVKLKTSNGEKIIQSVEFSTTNQISFWNLGNEIRIGNQFDGNLDEFRLWRVALQDSRFENHTLFPDAIDGNTITSSTDDLIFRLDFEYPKDRVLDVNIKNVAINQTYSEPFATAINFYSASEYPYQYFPYERLVTATVPSTGYGFANKIRFEDQTLIKDLSYKSRSTLKSFDTSPIDSNRLGIFFSPIKELNLDILKAFGKFNIDDFIGDPKDQYNDTYKSLDRLREYYFERISLNVSEYIQLVKYINKSLFDVLADLTPARAKVAKGLLIEPHLLERNKIRWDKPKAEDKTFFTEINVDNDTDVEMKFSVYNAFFDYDEEVVLESNLKMYSAEITEDDNITIDVTKPTYQTEIDYFKDINVIGTIPTYKARITYELRYELLSEVETLGRFESIGTDRNSMANLGFGLYAEDTTTIWNRYDNGGNRFKTRENVFLIETEVLKNVKTQVSGFPRPESQPGDAVVFEDIPTPFKQYVVTLLPFPSQSQQSGNVTKITPLRGYFPTHYKFVNNLYEGLQRSFFKGSTQTDNTTPDGLPVVQTFTTNPNILRVADTGRGSGEPILIID